MHGWPHAKSLSREALMLLLASARKKLNKMIICHTVDVSLTFIFRPFRPRVLGWPHAKSLSREALMLLLASARKKLNKMIICHAVDASLSHKPYLFYFPFFLCVHVFFVFLPKQRCSRGLSSVAPRLLFELFKLFFNYGIVPQGIVFVVFVVFKNRRADAIRRIRLISCLIILVVRVFFGRDDVGAFEQDGWQFVDVEVGAVLSLVNHRGVDLDNVGFTVCVHNCFSFY